MPAALPSAICHAPSPVLLFAPPPNDPTWSKLPHDERVRVSVRLGRLCLIHASDNITAECRRIAASLHSRGETAGTLLRLYYAYTRYGKKVGATTYAPGDWRCVVDWSKAGPSARGAQDEALPADFVEKLWRKLCDKHQRVVSSAYRELINIWQTGYDFDRNRYKEIPGYSQWPAPNGDGKPHGWTQRNLYRYAPDSFERKAATIGIQCASQEGLKLRTSRVGLRLCERVEFDDHEFDVKTDFPGQLRSLRPRSFASADHLTNVCPNMVMKPTFWDEEEEVKKTLTETDFTWFVVSQLTEIGFRADDVGTAFIVEWGTSAIRGNKKMPLGDSLRDDFEQRIYDCTGGKVTVKRSGRFHQTANGSQLASPSGGNFRFKAIIELYWRLINDRLDSLPGQVGKDRLHAPEELERTDAYVQRLLKAAAAMSPDRAAELIIPRLTWDEFLDYAWTARQAINDDTTHAIQGWEKCGFLAKEWRRPQIPSSRGEGQGEGELQLSQGNSSAWQPLATLAQLPEPERSELTRAINANDNLYRVRRMSRWEAWQKHVHELTRLSPLMIPALVGPRHALLCNGSPEHTVRNGVIEIQDWRIGPDPIAFIAIRPRGVAPSPQERGLGDGNFQGSDLSGYDRLPNGSKWTCYVNPLAPTCMVVCDAAGRAVSACPPMPMPAANDDHAIKASLGLQRSWYARALSAQRARHATDAAALKFMRSHNEAILAGRQTPAEKVRSRQLRRANLSTDTLLDPVEAAPSTASVRPNPIPSPRGDGQGEGEFSAPISSPAEQQPARLDLNPESLL